MSVLQLRWLLVLAVLLAASSAAPAGAVVDASPSRHESMFDRGPLAGLEYADQGRLRPNAEAPRLEEGEPIPNRYIVVLEDSVGQPGKVAQSQVEERGGDLGFVYRYTIKGYSAALSKADVKALERDPRVKYVTPDHIVSVASQTTPTGIDRTYAASNPSLAIDGAENLNVNADVAVIDTGVDYGHPDLSVAGRTNCVPAGEDPEDPVQGAIKSCSDGSGTDGEGHGTHVAGTIGALDNGTGVVGVAPGARLWAVRVLNNKGSGSQSWIVAGVEWVTAHSQQIEVANMSLGCNCSLPALDEAIEASTEAGVAYVVAAGNDNDDAQDFSPASNGNVITVSAIADHDGMPGGKGHNALGYGGRDDHRAGFSNYGSSIEIAAPGVLINSTLPEGGYGILSGTSMAAPHVAGAAAVLASQDNPEDLSDVEAIRSTITEEGNKDWIDTSGDGFHEPLLDLSDYKAFNGNNQDVVTLKPIILSSGKATLRGSVRAAGWSNFRYHFEYGPTIGYGTTVPFAPGDLVESPSDFTEVTKTVEGLQGHTVYHYRVVAVYNGSYYFGPDQRFATTPPQVSTDGVSNVSLNHATLNGSVAPEGLDTQYYFEYGPTDTYSKMAPAEPVAVGAEVEELNPSVTVGGLSADSVYHYRVVAKNIAGVSYGPDEEFQTSAAVWKPRAAPELEGSSGPAEQTSLTGISCIERNECMAIGFRNPGDFQFETFSGWWNGESWATDLLPRADGSDFYWLNVVSCAGATFCVAGGYLNESSAFSPTLQHWDGNKWVIDPIELKINIEFGIVKDVSCVTAEFCMAVGIYHSDGEPGQLVLRWDGERWIQQLEAPNPAGERRGLEGVSCLSATWCMMTGFRQPDPEWPDPFSVVWLNGTWMVLPDGGSQPGSLAWLADVSCASPTNCIAIGGPEANGMFDGAELWNGEDWTPKPIPHPVGALYAVMDEVSCATVDRCTAVGYYAAPGPHAFPLAAEWQGDGWAVQSTRDPSQETLPMGYGSIFGGITCPSPSHCLATGVVTRAVQGAGPLVEEYEAPGPASTTRAADGITATNATLNANVDPRGAKTSFRFEYGPTPSYGSVQPVSPVDIGSSTAVAVSEELAELKPNFTYHFRVVASNANGTTYGANRQFTTKSLRPPSFIDTFGKIGSGAGNLDEPLGIDVDSTGNIWVADSDNDRVQKFSPSGTLLLTTGSTGTGNGQFNTPHDIAVDATGHVWVTDTYNNRLQKLDSTGKYLTKFGTNGSGNGQFFHPWGIDVDSKGQIWVADKGNQRIQRFNSLGGYLSQFPISGIASGVAVDSAGDVWATEPSSHRIRKFSPEGSPLVTVGSPESGDFSLPHGLVVDAANNVWVADTSNHRVRAFESDGRALTQFGVSGAGEGQLSYPGDLAFDPDGSIRVVDSGNHRVQKWSFGAPAVITEQADEVGGTSMTLNGAVNPEGSEAKYQFEYGNTTAYGTSVPVSPTSVGSGDKDVAVSVKISGLQPNTTYHFRIKATNAVGTVYGEDLTATTEREWYSLPVPSFEHYESQLKGVSCASPSYCMAVGYYKATSTGKKKTLTARWDGAQWTVIASPNPTLEDNILNGVSCVSSTSCVAVGRSVLSAASNAARPMALHWDGNEWVSKAVTPLSIIDNEHAGVACVTASSCRAVGRGKKTSTGNYRTIASHWSGGESWPLVTTPNEGEGENLLAGISCKSASECMAVGYYKNATTGKRRTLSLRWDGTQWTVIASPNQTTEDNILNAVSCTSATSCVAVGRSNVTSGTAFAQPLALHWNGSAWLGVSPPKLSINANEATGVSCESAASCVFVGRGKKTSTGPFRTLVEEWDGEAEGWQISPTPNLSETDNALNAVSCVTGTCVAVGSYVAPSGVPKLLGLRY